MITQKTSFTSSLCHKFVVCKKTLTSLSRSIIIKTLISYSKCAIYINTYCLTQGPLWMISMFYVSRIYCAQDMQSIESINRPTPHFHLPNPQTILLKLTKNYNDPKDLHMHPNFNSSKLVVVVGRFNQVWWVFKISAHILHCTVCNLMVHLEICKLKETQASVTTRAGRFAISWQPSISWS